VFAIESSIKLDAICRTIIMEFGPPNQPATELTPSDEKKESKKSKKKDAEKLGAFAVEAKPSQAATKATSSGERLASNTKSDKSERPLAKDEQSLSDNAPELNGEAPLEHLSEVETRAATQELARNRRAELAHELAETVVESPAADQAEAAAAFLAKAELSGDPEVAFEEVLAEFEIETAQESDGMASEDTLEEAEMADQPSRQSLIERVIDTHQTAEGDLPLSSDLAEAETAQDSATTAVVSNPARPATGGGTPPPRRPPNGGVAGQPSPYDGGAFPNFIPPRTVTSGPQATPNTISTEDAYYYERRAQVRGLLVGGIVGYLIGRRRGRIKTEKRLLPVQNKLEKEVQSLQANLLAKEIIIRQATAEKRRAPLSPASEQLITITAEHKHSLAAAAQSTEFKLPSERIGHVLIAAERKPVVPEAANVRPSAEKRAIEKQVTTMTRAELLVVSDKIVVEGTTLRQVYDTHLVGERGLRRLVTEHLNGGDVQGVLRRELVEREIDFERDPVLRDRARASLAGAGKSALNSLVQQAGAVAVVPNYGKVADQKNEQPTSASAKPLVNHHFADVALISTITVLVAIIVLLLARGQ